MNYDPVNTLYQNETQFSEVAFYSTVLSIQADVRSLTISFSFHFELRHEDICIKSGLCDSEYNP